MSEIGFISLANTVYLLLNSRFCYVNTNIVVRNERNEFYFATTSFGFDSVLAVRISSTGLMYFSPNGTFLLP